MFIFCFVVCMSVLCAYFVAQTPAEPGLLCFFAVDDSDMKIVSGPGLARKNREDAGEVAAQEYVDQKENGNLEKAHLLGKDLFAVFYQPDGPVLNIGTTSLEEKVRAQRKILFAFAAEAALDAGLHSTVLPQTAMQEFLNQLKQANEELYDKINDPKTFSYYLLYEKESYKYPSIGHAFALLCEEADNEDLISLGNLLYDEFNRLVLQMIADFSFVK